MRPFLLLVLLGLCFSCQNKTPSTPPRISADLQAALAAFEIADGFNIELVAAEPLLADPVAMEIDEDGRMYVAEMSGYPLDLHKKGRIKLLKDTNGDGYPDKAIVFADSLLLPTGLMRWRDGLLVTDPPNVYYLADTDGDDRADVRKIMLTGFALSNPQHNLNNPMFGLDNWIYLAHQWAFTPTVCKEFSDEGSEIRFPDRPKAARLGKNADDRNVRFKPDTYEMEALAAETQFGQTFDAWGRHFLTENADHIYQEVLGARYLKNNPQLLVPAADESIADHGTNCEVFPITEKPDHQLLTDVGVITSACGITYYLGGAFPAAFNQNTTFVAEPSHNLVHVDRISTKGAAFTASRIFEKKEFLASKDAWFRPVNFYIGPEGALYVVDYYRQIIEHPEWMSDEVNKSGMLYNGSDKGRIYRITPKGGLPMQWMKQLQLSKKSDLELVELLANENIWYRRTAQRLLFQRKTKATAALHKLAFRSHSAEARVHALWLLEGLGQSRVEDLVANLQHPEAGLRENALKISENHPEWSTELTEGILARQKDPSPRVRFQMLNTLGVLKGIPGSNAAKINVLERDVEDHWVQLALIAASAGEEPQLLQLADRKFGKDLSEKQARFFSYLAATIANGQDEQAIASLLVGHSAQVQTAIFQGLSQLWAYQGVPPAIGIPQQRRLLQYIDAKTPAALRSAALSMLQVCGIPAQERAAVATLAKATLNNPSADVAFRADAIALQALINPDAQRAALMGLLIDKGPMPLREAALNGLDQCSGLEASQFITQNWSKLDSSLQDQSIDVLMANAERCHQLITAVDNKTIQRDAIGWRRMVGLMNNDDVGVRVHARKVLAANGLAREAVYSSYLAALNQRGNYGKGKAVYERACQICHVMNGQGVAFGPDLGSVRNRQSAAILKEIIIPNHSIADKYEMWQLDMKGGKIAQGIISAKTSTTLSLKMLNGQNVTYARNEILKMTQAPSSAMPEGLEAGITVSEMADLLAYIKGIK
ncbi:PVC-type heme-binding CxxCH protein [Haliscomenobacter hydrossis]|uniref:Membrane-bound dehydrogenase domain protein n=1 Tax=Haliscomenobacter hydrossis (strain ATCC 27775 / DSM 1100 / LMG 10767 / O) TaxID=760192 RepID=F4L0C3_HALH1|nr:PVC-type heme-binding CxxCH protein [Haliscomenobacter hydrossis]AEE53796.1 membrane-bound dehydrogenase domain protein [Haliscomenobacter hydrossis DSM 1100]